jgi:hypothetical protein
MAACELGNRLREIREELYGEDGVPNLAKKVEVPSRTWSNYETGVTIPGIVLLRFIELTGASSHWLLTGQGPRLAGRPAASPFMESDRWHEK